MRRALDNSTAYGSDSRCRPLNTPSVAVAAIHNHASPPCSGALLTKTAISCYDIKRVDGSASTAGPETIQEVCRAQ
jgi:hypothetical protein